MRWSFTLPGQPPSINSTYKIVTKRGRRGSYLSLAKRDEVVAYQQSAIAIIGAARPSRWAPTGQVRLTYRMYLARNIDCDNVLKSIHDAFQAATNVNDSRVLPCVLSKEVVPSLRARLEVLVEDLG